MKLSRVTLCLPTKNRRVSHAFYVALGFEAVGELEPMQRAKEAGAWEAVFVRDGVAIEGSHSNLFAVCNGAIVTYPACNYILDGVTRGCVLALAGEMGIPARLCALPLPDLLAADEVFLTGTTTEVLPVVQVDGRRIGGGRPGPITLQLRERYLQRLDRGSG